jgi:hypothetical protein
MTAPLRTRAGSLGCLISEHFSRVGDSESATVRAVMAKIEHRVLAAVLVAGVVVGVPVVLPDAAVADVTEPVTATERDLRRQSLHVVPFWVDAEAPPRPLVEFAGDGKVAGGEGCSNVTSAWPGRPGRTLIITER